MFVREVSIRRMGQPEYIKQVVPIIAELFTPFTVRIERVELYECGEGYANLLHRFACAGNAPEYLVI